MNVDPAFSVTEPNVPVPEIEAPLLTIKPGNSIGTMEVQGSAVILEGAHARHDKGTAKLFTSMIAAMPPEVVKESRQHFTLQDRTASTE